MAQIFTIFFGSQRRIQIFATQIAFFNASSLALSGSLWLFLWLSLAYSLALFLALYLALSLAL